MSWDDEAATWDEGVPQWVYAAAAFESLRSVADRLDVGLEGATICDFGCGTGLLTEKLADSAAGIDAVDTSPAMLEVLESKIERNGWTHVRTSDRQPDAAGQYDLVVCSSVCAFLEDYPGTVEALVALLRPGGLFVQWDWELDPTSVDQFGLSREAIGAALRDAGLVDRTVETAFEAPVDGFIMRPLLGVGRTPGGSSLG